MPSTPIPDLARDVWRIDTRPIHHRNGFSAVLVEGHTLEEALMNFGGVFNYVEKRPPTKDDVLAIRSAAELVEAGVSSNPLHRMFELEQVGSQVVAWIGKPVINVPGRGHALYEAWASATGAESARVLMLDPSSGAAANG